MSLGVGPAAVPDYRKSPLRRRQLWLLLVAVWIGFNLRAAPGGVPLLLALVRPGDHLNYAVAGLATALPILGFGVMAVPGEALVRRRGGFWVVGIGLVLPVAGERGAGNAVAHSVTQPWGWWGSDGPAAVLGRLRICRPLSISSGS